MKSQVTFRLAHENDAEVLARAERAIAATPGLLVSVPSELTNERFAAKIAALGSADNGRYLVAEAEGQIVGHGMLDPLPLSAVRHVVHFDSSSPSRMAGAGRWRCAA